MPKKIKCPDCGSSKVSKLFCATETIIYCQNSTHKGFNAYKTTSELSKDYGKIFEKVAWDYECSDDKKE